MLAVEGLSKSFGGVAAIQDVSLKFASGSLTAIIGPNGAGKITFFNLISGAIRPDKGRVTLSGEDIVGLPPAQIVRRGIARSFQIASIFPSLTVEAILTATVQAHLRQAERIMRRFPLPECRERAFAAMDMLGLANKAAVVSANLSHGDQKLLDIGLALVLEPRVLLLDEPTAGMGSEERWQMIEKMRELWKRQNITLVFIEHDMDIVFKIAEAICVLCYGRVLVLPPSPAPTCRWTAAGWSRRRGTLTAGCVQRAGDGACLRSRDCRSPLAASPQSRMSRSSLRRARSRPSSGRTAPARSSSLARKQTARATSSGLTMRPSAEFSLSMETSRWPLSIAACRAGVSV
jgi:branched-chain amino acid transport system ATP-binding protein